MKRTATLTLIILIASSSLASAVGGNKAAYVGGTLPSYDMAGEPLEGHLDLGRAQLTFVPDAHAHAVQRLSIDYSSIRGLEFGQKAGRRPSLATGAMVLLGPFGLPALSAKRRAHYLTLVYVDQQGQNQVVVMALGKNIVRATLAALEARSGITVEYQDEEARKWSR